MMTLRDLCLVALGFVASVSAAPQAASSTTSSAATATPTYGIASQNLIYAQQLVYDLLAQHKDLVVLSLHGIPPGGVNGSIIAINLDRIGKPDDSDDDAVAVNHKTILAPNAGDPTRFEIATPIFNSAGKMLNASINMVFKYHYGDDQLAMLGKAVSYRNELAKNLKTYKQLFDPVKALNISSKYLHSTVIVSN
jgi:hypothetical protein